MGCHALLQGIFLIQGSNQSLLRFLYRRWILYRLSHQGSPDHRTLTFNLQDWKLQNVNKSLKKGAKQLGTTRGSYRMTMWEDLEGMIWLEKGGEMKLHLFSI